MKSEKTQIPPEPPNKTWIGVAFINERTGQVVTKEEEVLYSKWEKFEYLPLACQSPETRKEYAEWWEWYHKYKEPEQMNLFTVGG